METAGVNSERGFQRGLEKTVQSSISRCGRGPGVCATPGSTPGSPDPRDRALFTWMLRSVVGHHAGTAECPSLLVLGSEGSRALSQDSGHISDTPPPFPGLRTNLSGKTSGSQQRSHPLLNSHHCGPTSPAVRKSFSESNQRPCCCLHTDFPSLVLLC